MILYVTVGGTAFRGNDTHETEVVVPVPMHRDVVAEQVDLPGLVSEHVSIAGADNSAGANPAAKVMSLLAGMVAGAEAGACAGRSVGACAFGRLEAVVQRSNSVFTLCECPISILGR